MAEGLKTEELNGCAIQLRRKEEPAFGLPEHSAILGRQN
jgi:hypothetical protein